MPCSNLRKPLLLAALFASTLPATLLKAQTPTHTFAVSGNQFLMDGKPYQILSGEMHYPRVPRAYWRDRFQKARAMGLNTITVYVFWNAHEAKKGVYDFSGQNDIAEYIREAQQEGLNVILRPGPYICGEWELGGYPSWLLKDPNLVLRSDDPKYTAEVHTWLMRLGKEIKPLLLKNGGPIIAVQLENEYGSFGDDKAYLEELKKELHESGMGDSLIYTADGPEQLPKGSLPELPAVINFGTGDAEKAFATLAKERPDGPKMSGEYWAGWFDHWGEKHQVTDGNKEAAEYRWMIEHGYSVSMYMFHGGTSFGWMNGANSNGKNYQPDTTSYDYNAPLDEKGTPTAKFFAFRKAISEVTKTTPPPLPKPVTLQAFPIEPKMLSASLWKNLPKPVTSKKLLTFEDLDQPYGYVLYRTQLRAGDGGKLVLGGLHDYAQVYVDQKLVGTADRRLGTDTVELPAVARAATLDVLVENSGRVNYTKVIRTERTGLTGTVTLDGKEPVGWQIYSLAMDHVASLPFNAEPCSGPCFYQVQMDVQMPVDTYLNTSELHKGMVWLGERPLGRFWSVGPQYALYTPGPWLHAGKNAVHFFDLMGDSTDILTTTVAPIFDTPKK
ncbi:glycoside hydrolase family 35 protein [Granulicella paludicola]|uniref:glycoside hydrolase family 35 protein n=1 Tax=Granulicella paludicola TaxID=474951 RepID=UPI0021E0DD30|nr:beta-galactosidase family protein [Granulicella paludicola]